MRLPEHSTFDADATMAAEDARFSYARVSPGRSRSTVLPTWDGGAVFREGQLRYERLQSLGEGGMGEVSLARDHDIERRVAIKRLRPEHANTSALLRFAQEVRTIGSLEHPNIVPVHDVGIDEEGQHYFVMKYVEGETLESVIEKLQAHDPATERRFPIEARAQLFLGILRAVQYAHARGIIHRDIKPANIMVGPYGEVMLMDWGLARPVRGAEVVFPDEVPGGRRGLGRRACRRSTGPSWGRRTTCLRSRRAERPTASTSAATCTAWGCSSTSWCPCATTSTARTA
ncbi:MAG: serine/threonine protein kinase [Deltaproteobacteria bacterium]|nr:serine/threonine protein kinase [Deltaproteobacteria bacterium]